MVTDEMVEAGCKAYFKWYLGDWITEDQRDIARQQARTILEAALSAAEPIELRNDDVGFVDFLNSDRPYICRKTEGICYLLIDRETRDVIGYRKYDDTAPPAPSVAVKALEEAFKHFKVVYDPPNGISINEATRAEAIKLASSALCSTLSKVEIETLVACEDWKANFEIMRIRGVDNTAEAWRSSQRVVDNLLDRGLLEFGKPNTTYRITDAGRSALSAQVQDAAAKSLADAYQKYLDASDLYNERLAISKTKALGTMRVDEEYRAIDEARRAFDKLAVDIAKSALPAAPAKQEG